MYTSLAILAKHGVQYTMYMMHIVHDICIVYRVKTIHIAHFTYNVDNVYKCIQMYVTVY